MHRVARKLDLFKKLSVEEVDALQSIATETYVLPRRATLVHQDEPPTAMHFILEGFAAREKTLRDGRTQILSFLLPGDFCDLDITLLDVRDHSIVAMTDTIVARIDDAALARVSVQYSNLRAALRWASLIEESIAREWIINLGQRSALERIAHVFCETYHRLRAIGAARGNNSFMFPLTQEALGAATGLSAVHVNRTLQELRGAGLIAFGDNRVTVFDLEALEAAGDFESGYLHMDPALALC